MQRDKKLLYVLTVINILLISVSICLYLRAVKIGKLVEENTSNKKYIYSVKDGNIRLKIPNGKTVKIQISEQSIKVERIYEYDTDEERIYIIMFLKHYNKVTEGSLKREVFSMSGECRLHTILYKIGYGKDHSADVDIDNEKDKRWLVNVLSLLLY